MLGFPVISVTIGVLIALAVPGLMDSHFRGKRKKKSFARLCHIIGITIVIYALVTWCADIITNKF